MTKKILILAIDDRKCSYEGEYNYYLKQIHKWSVNIKIMTTRCSSRVVNIQKERESSLLLDACPNDAYKIALDEHGEEYKTTLFGELLNALLCEQQRNICFFIGGAAGHSCNLLQTADQIISLSKMTFPHKLARLILVEQIYRCHTMTVGHPYHRS